MTGGNLWCVPKQRYANVREHLALQGFPTRFKQVVANTTLKKQIGNSMSVCVIAAILKNIYLPKRAMPAFAYTAADVGASRSAAQVLTADRS